MRKRLFWTLFWLGAFLSYFLCELFLVVLNMALLAAIGTDMEAHLSDQMQRLGTNDIPYVLTGCDAFLRTALATPGLFRQEIEPSELASLRSRVEAAYADRRRLDLSGLTRNWHAAAALFKLYLRELPRVRAATCHLYPLPILV